MMTYVTAFIFYTLAMIGILLIGFIVYKKTFIIDKNENYNLQISRYRMRRCFLRRPQRPGFCYQGCEDPRYVCRPF